MVPLVPGSRIPGPQLLTSIVLFLRSLALTCINIRAPTERGTGRLPGLRQ